MKKSIIALNILLAASLMPASSDAAQKNMNKEFEQGMALKRAEKFSDAAAIFSKIVGLDPKNVDALQQLATLYGWLGRYDDSISAWKKAIELNRENIEFHVGLARVLSWKGELSSAKEEYLAALKIKSDDFDALVGLGDIGMREENVALAQGYYLKAQIQRPDDPDLKKKLAGAEPPLLWRLDAGFSYDGYHNSPARVAERNSYTQIGRQFGLGKSSLWLRHEWQNHFEMTDNPIYAGGSAWPVKFLAIQFEAGFTGMPNFLSTQQFNTLIDFPISRFLTPSIGLKYLNYRDGNVNLYTPGLKLQPLSWLALTYRHVFSKNITGPDTEGWLSQLELNSGEKVSVYMGYAEGSDSLPPLSSAFSNTLFSGVALQLNRRWAWRIDYSYENRPNFFFRSSIGTGFTFKF